MPQKMKKKMVPPGEWVTPQNAETKMAGFIKYYKENQLVQEDDWEPFFESLFKGASFSFRIGDLYRKTPGVYETKPGSLSQAEVLREFMRTNVFPKLENLTVKDKTFEITPISWYPRQLAWKCNIDHKALSTTPALRWFFDFLYIEEKAQFVFKQEVPSMITALLVDINPSHKILEMCCAPGYQSAQLSELFFSNPKKIPDGLMVCNDWETTRLHTQWISSPNTFFTHHDARNFPDLYTTPDHNPDKKLLYDRVFVDPPTSSDGTMRRNANMRGEWNISKAYKCHKDLLTMVRRGTALLALKGQLVYSTQSMNPVENEAVVAALIKESEGGLELVDVSKRIGDFSMRPGMTTWKVMSSKLEFFDTYEACPDWMQKDVPATVFAPAEDDPIDYHLDRCRRILPHDNDTGAAFYAVLVKKAEVPWQKEPQETMETEETKVEEKAEVKEEVKDEAVTENGDSEKSKSAPYTKPVRCDVTVGVAEIEWATATTDAALNTSVENDVSKFGVAPLKISKSCIPAWYQKKLDEATAQVEEVFPDDEAWTQIRTMFDVKKMDPTKHLLKYRQPTKEASYFYMNPMIRNLVLCNKELLKKSRLNTGGQKLMKGIENNDRADLTSMIGSLQGFLPVIPFVSKRLLHVTKAEMIMILEEATVPISKFSDKLQKEINAIREAGVVFFMYEPKGKNPDPKCTIIQRRDKFSTFIKDTRSFNHKGDKYHNLRMCGVDPTQSDEPAADVTVKTEVKTEEAAE